jgi:hypothetical protein
VRSGERGRAVTAVCRHQLTPEARSTRRRAWLARRFHGDGAPSPRYARTPGRGRPSPRVQSVLRLHWEGESSGLESRRQGTRSRNMGGTQRDAHATPSHGLHTELKCHRHLSCRFKVARAFQPVGTVCPHVFHGLESPCLSAVWPIDQSGIRFRAGRKVDPASHAGKRVPPPSHVHRSGGRSET